TYTTLMPRRNVTSLAHDPFFGMGSILAARMVASKNRVIATALMFLVPSMYHMLGGRFDTLIVQKSGWPMTRCIIFCHCIY
ncbi:MFS transporter, partial [Staphylococcus pseudintermedius]